MAGNVGMGMLVCVVYGNVGVRQNSSVHLRVSIECEARRRALRGGRHHCNSLSGGEGAAEGNTAHWGICNGGIDLAVTFNTNCSYYSLSVFLFPVLLLQPRVLGAEEGDRAVGVCLSRTTFLSLRATNLFDII